MIYIYIYHNISYVCVYACVYVYMCIYIYILCTIILRGLGGPRTAKCRRDAGMLRDVLMYAYICIYIYI